MKTNLKNVWRAYKTKLLKKWWAKEITAWVCTPIGKICIGCGRNSKYFSEEERDRFYLPIDTPLDVVKERVEEARLLYVSRKMIELKQRWEIELLNRTLSKL